MNADGVDAIAERLQGFHETQDSALVLDPALLVTAAAVLLDAFRDWDDEVGGSIDGDGVYAVAQVHMARLAVLDPDQSAPDMHAAARLFELVGRGDPDDVPEGARAAVEELRRQDAEDRPSVVAECLHNHAVVQESTYRSTGSFSCLDMSVTLWQRAVSASTLHHLPRYLRQLGAALSLRASETGSVADWDSAVSASQQAVADARALAMLNRLDEAELPTYLAALGLVHLLRFEEMGREEDRAAGIDAYRAAVDAARNVPSLHARLTAELDHLLDLGS